MGCLDPPLKEVPEHEWRCHVCLKNEVEGVQDCPDLRGNACRQDCLGIDRMGNKYWFLCRRLVVEMAEEGKDIRYYSTVKQLEELSEVLDDELYERDLWEAMELIRVDMERHMDVTEAITNRKKMPSKKSYFEVVDGKWDFSLKNNGSITVQSNLYISNFLVSGKTLLISRFCSSYLSREVSYIMISTSITTNQPQAAAAAITTATTIILKKPHKTQVRHIGVQCTRYHLLVGSSQLPGRGLVLAL